MACLRSLVFVRANPTVHAHVVRSVRLHTSASALATEGSQAAEQTTQAHDEEQALKTQLLDTALDNVPHYGWTTDAITEAAVQLGLPRISHGILYRGPIDLVDHFVESANARLVAHVTQHGLTSADLHGRLGEAMRLRLSMQIPYARQWPQAMALMVHPLHFAHSSKHLMRLVDDIWFHAGDRATDFSWYTKRTALAAIYNATELFMVQDTSPDYQATWTFLQSRLDHARRVAEGKEELLRAATVAVHGASALYTTIRNVTGFNDTRR
eukprot:Opistho-2@36063